MKSKIFIPFLILLISQTVSALPTAKITIKVIDEQGNPVEGAEAGLVLETPKGIGQGWGTDTVWVPGITDDEGFFTGEGATGPYVTLSAEKDGYYGVGSKFSQFTDVTGIFGFRKYKPWNPIIEVVLKKIINPIPMYAVRRSDGGQVRPAVMPVIGRFIGFDLMENDWVVPHGLGTHRDFLFKVDIDRAVSIRDYDVTLTLKFSNPKDGLIKYTPNTNKGRSVLRFPYHAPVMGYVDELVHHNESKPGEIEIGVSGNPDYDTNYFFRIRTELDDEGNVIGGLYGKIHGQIQIGNQAWLHDGKPNIYFDYYLNPNNNDTNIEYDLEKNLFKISTELFKVTNP